MRNPACLRLARSTLALLHARNSLCALCALYVLSPMRLVGAPARIATIEFFGHKGVDVAAVRAILPFHEGDELSSGEEAKARVREAVVRATGKPATDVNGVCCASDGGILLFIGIPGGSYKPFAYDPAPTGHARVSTELEQLDERLGQAIDAAVRKGGVPALEDHSKGYTLTKDPEARSLQLTLRRYALAHEPELVRVLTSSSDPSQRAIASHALGYARQSRRQLDALTRAARDPDEGVRNNVTRAMWVLARAHDTMARQIQPDVFIEMLNSGIWTDRNKGTLVLERLTANRNPSVLARLKTTALDSLIEMTLWRESNHAYAARMLLGRVAGIPEKQLEELAWKGPPETIVEALARKPGGM
jgi:hypothetical protein